MIDLVQDFFSGKVALVCFHADAGGSWMYALILDPTYDHGGAIFIGS